MTKTLKYLSLGLSVLFHPLFVPTYAICLLCWAQVHYMRLSAYGTAAGWLIGLTLLFTAIMPILVMYYLRTKNNISDYEISHKEERRAVYYCCLMLMGMWCWVLYTLGIRGYLFWLVISSVVVLLFVSIINYFWKISIHLAAWGAMIGAVAAYQWYNSINNLVFIPLLLLIALLVMYARIYLKQHSPMQVVLGLILGISTTFLSVYLPTVFSTYFLKL